MTTMLPALSIEQWTDLADPFEWTPEVAQLEADNLFDNGWLPICQGGTTLLLSPDGHVCSLNDLYECGWCAWGEYAQAVWWYLVEVWEIEAVRSGSRQIRRYAERRLQERKR